MRCYGREVYPGQAPGTIPLPCCSMAAWVANQEREVGRRRTKEGLAAAKARGKSLGRRRDLTGDQVQLARRMKDAGASGRKIAQLLEVDEKTVRNALKAEAR